MRLSQPLCVTLLVLLVISVQSSDGINFGGRANRNSEQHDDASTGTVTHPSSSQDDAMTCDNIMAKSLVKANEQKAVAEASRDEVKEAHEKQSAVLVDLQAEYKAAQDKIEASEKEMLNQQKIADQRLTTFSDEAARMLSEMQSEKDLVDAEHTKLKQAHETKNSDLAELEQHHQAAQEKIEEQQVQMEQGEKVLLEKIETLNKESTEKVTEVSKAKELLGKEHNALKENHETKTAKFVDLEANYQTALTQIENLTDKIENEKNLSLERVNTANKVAADKMLEVTEKHHAAIDTLEGGSAKEIQMLKEKVVKVDGDKNKMAQQIQALTAKLTKSKNVSTIWINHRFFLQSCTPMKLTLYIICSTVFTFQRTS